MSFHRLVISSALAGWVACIAPAAQSRDAAPTAAIPVTVAVENVDVEQVASLASGVPLRFTVFGTPRSLATLRIDGAGQGLELTETEPGIYEGTYVIDARDSIRANSRVTASLQRDGRVAYATLDEPLLLATGSVPWSTANAGAPVPAVPVPAVPAPPVVVIESRTPSPVPLAVSPSRAPLEGVETASAAAPREPVQCYDCAVVESVQPVEAPPRGGVVGAVGGAIAGAILGKELGAEHTRRVLSVLGAIGGALAGREIERQATRPTQYDVVLRRADGSVLKRRYEQAPPFRVGETIRLDTASGPGSRVPATL